MTSRPRKKLARTVLVLLLIAAAGSVVYAFFHSGPWVVPDAAKLVTNPIKSSEANMAAGRRLYLDKCAECHGESGKGDGERAKTYNTPPGNLTDAPRMNAQSDGELFYKISEGHRPMPAFKKRYTEEQRWQLVLFLRSLTARASPNDTSH